MVCKNCGNQVDDNAHICGHCGAILSIPVPPIPPIPPVPPIPPIPGVPPIPTPPVPGVPEKNEIPSEYEPMSPWAYFWVKILFCITFNGSNLNRRNFARSYWCGLLVAVIIILILLIISACFLGGLGVLKEIFD